MADNEYDKDQRYILKTLDELKSNVNELFKNDKAIEVSITSITSKLVIVGSIQVELILHKMMLLDI